MNAWIKAVALAALVMAEPARAADVPLFMSGNLLLQNCNSQNPGDRGLCVGFVMAVSDALNTATAEGGEIHGWQACIPPGVIGNQMRDVVLRDLHAHPELRHFSAVTIAAEAIAQAFPCPVAAAVRQ